MIHLRGCAIALSIMIAAAGAASAQSLSDSISRAGRAVALGGVHLGKVEVRDVTIGAPGKGPSIGHMVFSGFKRDGDRVRADRIDLENITLKLGSQVIEIPAIVISAADLPDTLFRGLTEGDASIDWPRLLADASIGRISIDRLTQSDATTHVQVVDKGLRLTGLKAGIVDAAEIAEITASGPLTPGSPQQMTFRIGAIHYEQMNVGESIRYLTGGGSGDAKPLLRRAVVNGFDINAADSVVHIERLEINDVEGRAPSEPAPDPALLQAGLGPQAKDPQARARAMSYLADVTHYLRVGRYRVEHMSVETPKGRFSIAGIGVSGASARGLDRFEIDGLDIPVPGAAMRLDRFELKGLDYGALVDAALEAGRTGKKAELPPQKIAAVMPRLAGLRLSRLDVRSPQAPFSLGDLRYEFGETADDATAELTISDLNIDLDRATPNPNRDKLIALGYGDLRMNGGLRIRWTPRDQAFSVENLGFAVDRAGRIDIRAQLNNVDVAKAMADPEAAETVLNRAQLGPMDIRLADLGLAEHFFAEAAKQAGLSPEAIRAGFAQEMRARAMTEFGPALDAASADAIAKFLQAPGSIKASITAAAGAPPLTLAEVQQFGPPILMQRLRIKLEATAK